MSGDLFVEPGELRAAVAEVGAATSALEHARGLLGAAGDSVRGGIDHGGRADDKVATFVRQWRSECEIVADLIGGFGAILTNAASCYEDLEGSFARCLDEVGG